MVKPLTGKVPVLFVSWKASNRTLCCMMTGMSSELAKPSRDLDVCLETCVPPVAVLLECDWDTMPNASMGSRLTNDQFDDPGTYRMLFALVRGILPRSAGIPGVLGIFRGIRTAPKNHNSGRPA